ncbi:MAG: hypothetical protein Solumvirus3_22 [Solumvirus sp.]|uniref:Uncharacterized protein n=1 Tax=Solumvirus sp. TaxID=2487773 RepID=A0A3G5AGD5_9VIRU|nr:MAG: hypothetical protein Solumvirus3_22 [Solumvirus sp.]
MSSKRAISIKEFNRKFVQFTKATQKSVKGDEKTKYITGPIAYNFGAADKPVLNEFLIDLCPLKARGIDSKQKNDGSKPPKPIPGVFEHSVMVLYDQNVQEQKECFEMWHALYKDSCDFVSTCPEDFNKSKFSYEDAFDKGFKPPCNYPADKTTKKLDKTRSPAHWLKCYERKTPFGNERTLFSGLDGKPVPWEKLRNVDMTFVPRMHVKSLYGNGNNISIQIEMRSAVIIDIKARNTQNDQTDVIESLLKSNPELLDKVSKQLEGLTLNSTVSTASSDKQEPKKEEPKNDVLSLQSETKSKDVVQTQQFSGSSGTGQYPSNQVNNMQPMQYNIPQQPQQPQQMMNQQQMMNPQQFGGYQMPQQQMMQPYQPNTFQNGGTAPIVGQPLVTNLGAQMPNIPMMPKTQS